MRNTPRPAAPEAVRSWLVLTLPLLFLVAACGGPPVPPRPDFQPVVRAPSVYGLIGERDRLDLTSAQIEALDSIGSWFAEETSAMREDVGDERRRSMPADTVAAGQARREIQQANDQLMNGVFAVLTPDQRETACRLDGEQEARPDPGARAPRQGEERFSRRVWSWCSEDTGPEQRTA